MIAIHINENVGGQSNDYLQRFIQEVRLYSELELRDVLSGDTLVIELEKLFSDNEGVDVHELLGEEHLAVSF